MIFERAHVTELLTDSASEDTWTEGHRLGTQQVVLTIDSGKHKGQELIAVNYLSAYGNIDLKEGTKVIVKLDYEANGQVYIATISSYDRSVVVIGLVVIFVTFLLLFGGKKGLSAVLGLGFTVFSIWFFLIPLLKRGYSPIPAAIALVSITTFASLTFLNGFSRKTLGAAIGCIGGVTIAGLVAYAAGSLTPLDGFNMPEAEELILRSSGSGLAISGLLVSGILIAALGAVMDVAMTITSAVAELHEMNPKAKRSELFKSGLNIGRDAMGTMSNTLILAFAGASLNMLVLFRIFDYPYLQIFNSDLMTIEIIQGLAGSIGIVLTVPLVAALSANMYGGGSKNTENKPLLQ
ncbi:YibE/F family protein [Fusibacter sp. A1]|nr:YibE/F family protein [Fusibacter sp. A1]RXV63780.1 YibE/F family protein [Fusibacter sp. A1]